MNESVLRFLAVVVLASQLGCGYVAAGDWDDDPKNWSRSGAGSLPPGWQVVRSRYHRYPHWTHESVYWFHVRIPDGDRSWQAPDLVRFKGDLKSLWDGCPAMPDWFAPALSGRSGYEVWLSSQSRNFMLVVSPNGRELFSRDCQL